MSAPLVQKFSHLAKMKHADQALGLLEKVASLVKPIMKKHGWTLPLLAEFFPSSPGLLGMNYNGGQKILIRLRPAHAPDTFLDLEQDLIGTMLHELTHNVHGPHDEKFYAFLKVLNDEYDALRSGGYTGEGFLSNGSRVGQGVAHDLPPHLAKAKALAAAEERAKKQRLMGPGGKIGGVRKVGKTPRELAADAAERRMRDDKACGSTGRKEMEEEEMKRAERDGVEDVASEKDQPAVDVDLNALVDVAPLPAKPSALSGAPPLPSSQPELPTNPAAASASSSSQVNPLKRSAPPAPPTAPPSSSTSTSSPAPRPPTGRPAQPPPSSPPPSALLNHPSQWPCPTCTFLNASLLPTCEICETSRPPAPEPAGTWRCEKCGVRGNEDGFWSCRVCGEIKGRS